MIVNQDAWRDPRAAKSLAELGADVIKPHSFEKETRYFQEPTISRRAKVKRIDFPEE